MRLFNFHRSSASYRVRIALALKDLDYEYVAVRLDWDPGRSEQLAVPYVRKNPQKLVPMLEVGDLRVTQTLAIFDYLDRAAPDPPLFPSDAAERSRVMSLTAYIGSEIQPLQNLRVERYLADAFGVDLVGLARWRTHWITEGFKAVEQVLGEPESGRFCHGDAPTAADCFLVPQVYNARRGKVDMEAFPRIAQVVENCLALPAFSETVAEKMPDHEEMERH